MLPIESEFLSIGTGIGFIEKQICNLREDVTIDCFDFSSIAGNWLADVKRTKRLKSLDPQKTYRFIYCVQLMYALSDREIKDLSQVISQSLDKDGMFLTVDTSLNSIENGDLVCVKNAMFKVIKSLLRACFVFSFSRHKSQFWGW